MVASVAVWVLAGFYSRFPSLPWPVFPNLPRCQAEANFSSSCPVAVSGERMGRTSRDLATARMSLLLWIDGFVSAKHQITIQFLGRAGRKFVVSLGTQ